MATVRGGDIRQLTINGREFEVKSEASVSVDLGGFANEMAFAGNGVIVPTQKRKAAGFSGCTLLIEDGRKDLEYIQNLSNVGNPVPVNMTVASGLVYSGNLTVVGELQKNQGDGTLDLEMRGARFEQI